MNNNWEYLTPMGDQKVAIKDYEFFILSAKEEDEKNVETTKRFIQYVNEKQLSELRAIDVADRITAILKVSKMIQKEATRAKVDECLERVLKDVVAFDSKFIFPSYWDLVGGLIPWE